jgi:predicted RNA binding protein YcfA (HicA-like mRNA interferase family)
VKQTALTLEAEGWQPLRRTGSGHYMYEHVTGKTITFPATPSDHRSLKNTIAQARRATREWLEQQPPPPSAEALRDKKRDERQAEHHRKHAARVAASDVLTELKRAKELAGFYRKSGRDPVSALRRLVAAYEAALPAMTQKRHIGEQKLAALRVRLAEREREEELAGRTPEEHAREAAFVELPPPLHPEPVEQPAASDTLVNLRGPVQPVTLNRWPRFEHGQDGVAARLFALPDGTPVRLLMRDGKSVKGLLRKMAGTLLRIDMGDYMTGTKREGPEMTMYLEPGLVHGFILLTSTAPMEPLS